MDMELMALQNYNTRSLMSLPVGKKPVGSKWVYKIKRRADGSIERYKARLVAKGLYTSWRCWFHEDISPSTVRCLLTVAAAKQLDWSQLDATNALLHEDLHEVYMLPPPSMLMAGDKRVYKLNKSIYGLRQASSQWFVKLSTALMKYGVYLVKIIQETEFLHFLQFSNTRVE